MGAPGLTDPREQSLAKAPTKLGAVRCGETSRSRELPPTRGDREERSPAPPGRAKPWSHLRGSVRADHDSETGFDAHRWSRRRRTDLRGRRSDATPLRRAYTQRAPSEAREGPAASTPPLRRAPLRAWRRGAWPPRSVAPRSVAPRSVAPRSVGTGWGCSPLSGYPCSGRFLDLHRDRMASRGPHGASRRRHPHPVPTRVTPSRKKIWSRCIPATLAAMSLYYAHQRHHEV